MSQTPPPPGEPPQVPPTAPPAPGYAAPQQPYGYQQPYAYPYPPQPPTNSLAIVTLVLGFVVPFAAIVTGHIALGQIKRTGESGRGMALAGLILGYVFTGLLVLYVLFVVVVFGIFGALFVGFATTVPWETVAP